ncbi:MAG: hypothetical protein K2Y40_16840 [Reyranella sp.]|nr:hypothetical protein [Reyranella sp.]
MAHTANDAIDVFDREKHLFSIPNLTGVAGALVSDESQLIFSSNRAENTVGIFAPGPDPEVTKVAVGIRPNGLAYDHGRKLLLAANVGDPAIPRSYTLTMVDVGARAVRASIEVPGRTRWAVFDPDAGVFYVNISDPAVIVVVDARKPAEIARTVAIPAAGPHGLDIDRATGRLFCACDAGVLVTLDARSGRILDEKPLGGVPDVVFFNRQRQHLYVAIGNPGIIDVFSTSDMKKIATIETEPGAHTTALSPAGERLYVFLPRTHRAAVYET